MGIPACLFIINKYKPKERKGKVFFLYGANDFLEGKNQNKLRKEDIEKIVNSFREYRSIDKYCSPISLDEIRANDCNLNITRYIDVTEEEEEIDVQKVLDELNELKGERSAIEKKMNAFLKELGYQVLICFKIKKTLNSY
jgi:type I restriction enzyme M protein